MLDVWVVSGCLLGVCALLAGEAWWLRHLRRSLPLRIAVTGTRGKSSVTRLIAAGLRAGGVRVVYKTTGSAAVIGDPSGAEHPVRRRAAPTPLEQRQLLHRATTWGASVLVAEAMSIRPESLAAELRRILVPTLVAITNVRADHVADLAEPARAFAHAVPRTACVLFPDASKEDLSAALAARGVTAEAVPELGRSGVGDEPYLEWPDNVSLALAVCERAGVARDVALRGMRSVRPDVGALAAWRVSDGETTWTAVNGFAANDPQSTLAALSRSLSTWKPPGACVIGLLNLRRDRGDRTAQWFALLREDPQLFDRLVLLGDVPWCSARRLRAIYGNRAIALGSRRAEDVMRAIRDLEWGGGFLFGFGNIGGLGMELVRLWQERGVRI